MDYTTHAHFLQLWGWKVQEQGASRFAVCWVPSSWWKELAFLLDPQGEERKRLWSLALFKVLALVARLYPSLCDPLTVACQASLLIEFSRWKYWSGLPFRSAGYLPDPGLEPRSPALQADSTLWAPRGALLPLFGVCSNPIMEMLSYDLI